MRALLSRLLTLRAQSASYEADRLRQRCEWRRAAFLFLKAARAWELAARWTQPRWRHGCFKLAEAMDREAATACDFSGHRMDDAAVRVEFREGARVN